MYWAISYQSIIRFIIAWYSDFFLYNSDMTWLLLSLIIFRQPTKTCVPSSIAYAYNSTIGGNLTPLQVVKKTGVKWGKWNYGNFLETVNEYYPELKVTKTKDPKPPFFAVGYYVQYNRDWTITGRQEKRWHMVYVYTWYSDVYLYANSYGTNRGMSWHWYFTKEQLKLFKHFYNVGVPLKKEKPLPSRD